TAGANAVWNSNQGLAADQRAGLQPAAKKSVKTARSTKTESTKTESTKTEMPDFVEPQLCQASERPPNGDNWVHEIKLDGYRIQMRVEDGEVSLKTRKALNWTEKFPE